jgi:hypothetical protein
MGMSRPQCSHHINVRLERLRGTSHFRCNPAIDHNLANKTISPRTTIPSAPPKICDSGQQYPYFRNLLESGKSHVPASRT